MASDTNIRGITVGTGADVDADLNVYTRLPGNSAAGVPIGGGNDNAAAMCSEVDTGEVTGLRDIITPETDDDFRERIAHDNLCVQHTFDGTAQDTSKTYHEFATMTATQSAAGMLTNSGSSVTTNHGMTHAMRALYRIGGTETLVCETSVSFSAQPTANSVIDFGMFLRGTTPLFAPLDGVYFRVTSAGVFGVTNNNGTESPTAVFPLAAGAGTWVYTNGTVYRFLLQVTNVRTTFWINNTKYGEVSTPPGLGFPCASQALGWSMRQANNGTAGAVIQSLIKDVRVLVRGPNYSDTMSAIFARSFGAYQGLSASAIGTVGTYTNNTNPTAATPSNTTLAVGAVGLLNQAWETFNLAVNTDGILLSYQVPAGTAAIAGRRLKVAGVKLSSFVQTVLAGGPQSRVFALNFGHTSVTLAGTETASFVTGSTKNRRVVLLPELTQTITAAQAVSTAINQPGAYVSMFPEAIYVNPGEFVAVSVKGIGTVGTGGTIATYVQLIYSYE
jgi:hypothetical protein